MSQVDIEPLMLLVEEYKLMELWGDTLYEMPAEERKRVAETRLAKCITKFKGLMESPSNNGLPRYQKWAVHKALGLPFRPRSGSYTYMY